MALESAEQCGVIMDSETGEFCAGKSVREMHASGEPHLHAGLFLLRRNTKTQALEVLLQQRKPWLDQFGGRWCFTAGGHVTVLDMKRSDETFATYASADTLCMGREAEEEAGIFAQGLNMNGEVSAFLDKLGAKERVTKQSFHRLESLQVPTSEQNPFAENPVVSVGYYLLEKGDIQYTAGNEVLAFEWVSVLEALPWYDFPGTCEKRLLTPWAAHFLDLQFHNADSHKNWG